MEPRAEGTKRSEAVNLHLSGNISGGLRGQGWYSKFRRQNLKGGGSHEQRKPTGLQGTPRGGPGAPSKEAWDVLGMSP